MFLRTRNAFWPRERSLNGPVTFKLFLLYATLHKPGLVHRKWERCEGKVLQTTAIKTC